MHFGRQKQAAFVEKSFLPAQICYRLFAPQSSDDHADLFAGLVLAPRPVFDISVSPVS